MDERTNSSISTIFALVNSMVGGAMLTFPVLFKNAGLITGSLMLFISGFISFKTCRIYLFHMSKEDKDVQSTINRILGKKWQGVFRIITGFYLILLNIIYIDLIVDQTYSIILFILHKTDHSDWIADKDADYLVFDKFSIQYMSIIVFLPLLYMIFIKQMNLLIKLAEYGMYSAFIYFAFILYEFFSSLIGSEINMQEINWWSWDVGNLAGGCALAFTIHTTATPMLRQNQNQKNNGRDLAFSYSLGFLLYLFIGILGAFAISGKTCKTTIVNCYLDDYEVLLVQVSYLFGRITVFPILLDISRTRLLEHFYPAITEKVFKRFNWGFMLIATLFSFLSPYLPIDLVMNIVGAVVCYFFIYALPTMIHFTCLFKIKTNEEIITESMLSRSEEESTPVECGHDEDESKRYPKLLRIIFYSVINVIGVAIGIYGVYTFIKGFFP